MDDKLLPPAPPKPAPLTIVNLIPRANEYAAGAKSPATQRAYSGAWKRFDAWCEGAGLPSLPTSPETLALYVTHLADWGMRPGSIDKAVCAIAHAHHRANVPSPHQAARVTETMAGIRRALGTAPTPKAPLLSRDLRSIVNRLPTTTAGLRDRVVLLLGWTGAFRRSELVALEVRDLTFTDEGMAVLIRRSKTDQEGKGRIIGVPLGANPRACAVTAVREWLAATKIESGPILRAVSRVGNVRPKGLTGQSVALIVKRHVKAAGLDPKLYAGHSLRSGFVTSAAIAGKNRKSIKEITGHKTDAMLDRYIRTVSIWDDNAAKGLL